MTTSVQRRRGSTTQHSTFTGLEGEITIDTTKDTAVIHDGSTVGGFPLAKENFSNGNPVTLNAIAGAATANDDLFLIYDSSTNEMKKITRAELNNAIEADALANVTITGGSINGTTIGASTASTGAFTTLSASSTATLNTLVSSGATLTGGSINGMAIGASTASTGRFSALTNTALTSGRVTYAGTSGVLQDDADFTFNGTTVTMANDASISGLTVGKGGGAVASNTAVGSSALAANTTGANITALGVQALVNNTTGNTNTVVGTGAMSLNTTANGNCAFGYQAAYSNTGSGPVDAFGNRALFSNTTGTSNAAFGSSALFANTTGAANIAFGQGALGTNTTGQLNTALGAFALQANTTASANIGVGYLALYSNTTGANNTAIGNQTLYSNTTASYNTAVGYQSLYSNTTGQQNTAIGDSAAYTNTTGTRLVAVGIDAARFTTGNDITAIGTSAIRGGSGNNNQGFGNNSGYSLTTGNGNLLLGMQAGYSVTTGSGNTFVGPNWTTNGSGYAMTTGGNNTILGPYTGNMDSYDMRTLTNRVVLADGAGNRQLTMYEGGTVALDSAVPVAGTGITFPATQSASSDANTLDDYEEGTWTPVITAGIGSLTAYTSNGTYTKIGNIVTLWGRFLITTTGTASGGATIAGAPFTSSINIGQTIGVCRETAVTGQLYQVFISDNSTSVLAQSLIGGAIVWVDTYSYSFSLVYRV